MLKIIILASLFLSNINFAFSQTASSNQALVPNPIPPSPNAASLGKYGNIEVSKYTGVPNISLPIWQISEGDIIVPISLSYHPSGIRVEENASWVGLGWSLNAGGVITRSVRGKPDEHGYLFNSVPSPQDRANNLIPNLLLTLNNSASTASICDLIDGEYYCHEVVADGFDSEPDIYYFNFNGISGKFVLDQQGNAYTIPFQKIKIEKVSATNGWKITTPDGMQYRFNNIETTTNSNVNYNFFGGVVGDNITTSAPFVSSWYLSDIQSPTGHSITFNYQEEDYNTHSGPSQSLTWDVSNANNFSASNNVNTTGSTTQIVGQRLSSIVFSNGKVDFIATKTREDLDYYPQTNPNALEKISVSNKNGYIRHFVLGMNYFTSSDAKQNCDTKRLRLNSVTEWSGDMTISKPPYQFNYDNSGTLPSKISSSQDHWGFYNGKPNIDINGHPTLIPDIKFTLLNAQSNFSYYDAYSGNNSSNSFDPSVITLLSYKGADRTPDFNFAKIGILNKITYPTGGYTAYEYEQNDYDLKSGNYIYQTDQHTVRSSSSPGPNNTSPDDQTIYNSSQGSYTNIQTFNPSQFINSSNSNFNQTISVNLTISFVNGGQIFYNCEFHEPHAYLIDATTNKVLIDIEGRAGTQSAVLDNSVQIQINQKTLIFSGDKTSNYTPGDNGTSWNSIPIFYFTNLQLDPTHIYQLKTVTVNGHPGDCQVHNGDAKPAQDIVTNATLGLECYINTGAIIQYNGIVGGLRIKKISDFGNLGYPVFKQYTYKLSSNLNLSSGVIEDLPVYFDQFQKLLPNGQIQNGSQVPMAVVPACMVGASSTLISLSSGSKFELGQTNGSSVGYKEVQETKCSNETCSGTPLGYNNYTFTSSDDFPDFNAGVSGYAYWRTDAFSGPPSNSNCTNTTTWDPAMYSLRYLPPPLPGKNSFPYPYKTCFDWKRGLPVSEEYFEFDKTSNKTISRKKVSYFYDDVNNPNNSKIISGLRIVTSPNGRLSDMFFARYDYIARWNYKTQEVTTEIDKNGNQIITTQNDFYDNPSLGFLSRQETTNSKHENLKTTYTYAGDMSSQAPYSTMATRFELSPVIVKSNYNNNSQLQSATTNYTDWGNGIIKPSSIQTSLRSSVPDTRVQFYKYDNLGNLLSASKANDERLGYIYDYAKTYPIAAVANSNPLQVASITDPSQQIAYTSFEADGLGNWTSFTSSSIYNGSVTGTKCYVLNGTNPITKTDLINGNYIVSYWLQGVGSVSVNGSTGTAVTTKNGWTLYSQTLNSVNTISVSGNGTIDELRLYPAVAQMTTYTYAPLIGMTSQCDAANHITYYEYDGLGRLLLIKDQDGKILKRYDYKYQVAP